VLNGTYRLDAFLGQGLTGITYNAWHLRQKQPFAVKLLHRDLQPSHERVVKLRQDLRVLAGLRKKGFLPVELSFAPDGAPFLASELLIGETLRDRLEPGPLSPRLSLRLMIELCDALNAAHRRGVIHRDLKPENLFLVRVDSPGPDELDTTLKVLDFGLSKLLDGVEITGTGRLLGSPSYMSPEQARGDSHLVDARSDIFAVGVLLYECLFGDKMFNAERLEQKRQQIMAAKLPPLPFGERGLPLVDAIIARACSRRPEDRYQTAAALKDALEEAEKTLLRQATGVAAQLLVPAIVPALGLAPAPSSASAGQRPPPLPAALIGDRTSNASSVGGGELVVEQPSVPPRRKNGAMVALVAGVAGLTILGGLGYTLLSRRPPTSAIGTTDPVAGAGPATPGPSKPGPSQPGPGGSVDAPASPQPQPQPFPAASRTSSKRS